eukprot:CAMPEP_0204325734 /NCGR_PEP_ID=MMETSP0469-20131031/11241_1 /ASSEMBLY_ACC=CAM_ASM_000384 /TAXON_ID=2969 /ORGANISM="Oxyrrhis marina" /LENGTH=941 /DNA_ID=CAMNT_0051307641 /DNA_START=38 /DNA_END=2860 /DNA_ORIENTATION=+
MRVPRSLSELRARVTRAAHTQASGQAAARLRPLFADRPAARPAAHSPTAAPLAQAVQTRQGAIPTVFSSTAQDFDRLRGLKTVRLDGGDPEEKRVEIRRYFHDVADMFEKLHGMLAAPEAFFVRHEPLRHPPIFYIGHTASFFMNKLVLGKFLPAHLRVDPEIEMQTAVGVDENDWDDLEAAHYAWPTATEAAANPQRAEAFLARYVEYRQKIRQVVDDCIVSQPIELPIKPDSFWYCLLMAIEHEIIHFETSSVILRQADLKYVKPTPLLPPCPFSRQSRADVPANELVHIAGGSTRMGRSWADPKIYGWDNEFADPVSVEDVKPFQASRFLVSNAEFADFVSAGGYGDTQWWCDEGWSWVSQSGSSAPRFWRWDEGKWLLRTMTGEQSMPWDWPVEVNNLEAMAFCRFKAVETGHPVRLPTEGEFNLMRDSIPTDIQDSAHGPAWDRGAAPANIALEYWASTSPIDHFVNQDGIGDVMGNLWQHSVTNFDVFPGFKTHPLYDDFTTPQVDGSHTRMQGGSWASVGANGASRDARFAFRRHFYQHAGFRYVVGDPAPPQTSVAYESDKGLCGALSHHFDASPVTGSIYPEDLAALISRHCPAPSRILEVGCGPGRTALELARQAPHEVLAADLTTRRFEHTLKMLGDAGKLRWARVVEGDLVDYREVNSGSWDLKGSLRWAQVPDPAALDLKKHGTFDVLVAAQIAAMATMPDPEGFIANVHKMLRSDGLLVVGSVGELDLSELHDHFTQVGTYQLPFGQWVTERLHRCGSASVTVWKKGSHDPAASSTKVQRPESSVGSVLDAAVAAGRRVFPSAGVVRVDRASGQHTICDGPPSLIVLDELDRAQDPREYVRKAANLIGDSGALVIASCYDWQEEFTPRAKWLGAYKYGDNDAPRTYEAMRQLLAELGFTEACSPLEIPAVEYVGAVGEWGQQQVSVW